MGKPRSSRRPPQPSKPRLTHFLCLPLVTPDSRPQLEASLRAFREDVSPAASERNSPDEGQGNPIVHPKAIRPLGSLHCTLGVMSLDESKLSEAIAVLQGLDTQSILRDVEGRTTQSTSAGEASDLERTTSPPSIDQASYRPVEMSLKGLVSMHNPQSTSVLYAVPVDRTGQLLPLCLAIQRLFQDKGLLVEDKRDLKLHATIVNTIYAKNKRGQWGRNATARGGGSASSATQSNDPQGNGPNANSQLKIDATSTLEKYKDFVWAENMDLERIDICEMGAKKVLDGDGNVIDEEYTTVASVYLPK